MKGTWSIFRGLVRCGVFGSVYGGTAGAIYGTSYLPGGGTIWGGILGGAGGFISGVIGGSLGGWRGWCLGGCIGGLSVGGLIGFDDLLACSVVIGIAAIIGLLTGSMIQRGIGILPLFEFLVESRDFQNLQGWSRRRLVGASLALLFGSAAFWCIYVSYRAIQERRHWSARSTIFRDTLAVRFRGAMTNEMPVL